MSRLRMVCTCGACPEQYDVYDENNEKVGYMRFRWGNYTVECPDSGGEFVYSWSSDDGMQGCGLPYEQREAGLQAIEAYLKGERGE